MTPREQIEAALAQSRAERDKAAAERATAGVEWRKQEDAKVTNVTYNKVRSDWVRADAEWNRANAAVDKLTAALAELSRAESIAYQRVTLEAAVTKTRTERDKADAALAAVARARADREKTAGAAPAPVERRGGNNERRKRRDQQAQPGNIDNAAKEWNDAVANYNRAEAEWNRARAALAEFNKVNSKK